MTQKNLTWDEACNMDPRLESEAKEIIPLAKQAASIIREKYPKYFDIHDTKGFDSVVDNLEERLKKEVHLPEGVRQHYEYFNGGVIIKFYVDSSKRLYTLNAGDPSIAVRTAELDTYGNDYYKYKVPRKGFLRKLLGDKIERSGCIPVPESLGKSAAT